MSVDPQRPALDPATVAQEHGTLFPEPFRSRIGPRVRQRLGDALGLSQFGVNLVTLPPGARSALRHWHTLEDEFVYVLAGELALVTDAGEQTLTAGMCAGFKAGVRDGHHLVNHSTRPAQYLEVGSRREGDVAGYPDDDLLLVLTVDGEKVLHKDGTAY